MPSLLLFKELGPVAEAAGEEATVAPDDWVDAEGFAFRSAACTTDRP